MTDAQLLRSFAGQNSEPAFRTLVERHLPLVFGTAQRMTGNHALAEDITQTVFILLAQKAASLGRHPLLSGWLHQTTRFVTARALTAEHRRRRREQEAVTMQKISEPDEAWLNFSPQLDGALAQLSEPDRAAILLRYFERQPLRGVGLALGLSEDAAKKRVTRALEKLRRKMNRPGIEISAGALAAGLASEAAKAESARLLAGKIISVVVARVAAGAGAAGGSALLTSVVAALRWAKILNAAMATIALAAAILVLPRAARYWQRIEIPNSHTAIGDSGRTQKTKLPAKSPAAPFNKSTGFWRDLLVTVVDGETGAVVPGAKLRPFVNGLAVAEYSQPFFTGAAGTARVPVPVNPPDGERCNFFEIAIDAKGYAPRSMIWQSTTGMVLNIVASNHTARLERGCELSGVIVDDRERPLPNIHVATRAGGPQDNSAPVCQEDYSSYDLPMASSPVVTDENGRFTLSNFPGEIRALAFNFLMPDGSMRKFQTPGGSFTHVEVLPKVSMFELKRGTARLVIPGGTTVEGTVVNNSGTPIEGAEVVEAIERGNIEILSKNKTDAAGHFVLSNRPPQEIILGVSAEGSASISAMVSVQPGLKPLSLELPPELPLRGRVTDETGLSVFGAEVSVPDYFNSGQYTAWKDKTDANGQFSWPGAPTNELVVAISAPGYAYRIVRLRASTNEAAITMRFGNNKKTHITGVAMDAGSGSPIGHFQIKISHGLIHGYLEGPSQQFEGTHGRIDIKLLEKDFPIGGAEIWGMIVEADGYDSYVSRAYYPEEGDQQLTVKLKRGGTVEGIVRAPDGHPASKAQLAFVESGPLLSSTEAELPPYMVIDRTDPEGRFHLKKSSLSSNLVIFASSGWTVVPIVAGSQKTDVTLSAWARIEGTLKAGGEPIAGKTVTVEKLRQNFADPFAIFYRTATDDDGHFMFDNMPSGIFKLSCSAREGGRWDVPTLQTCVHLAAGETKTVEVGAGGQSITAQLQPPSGIAVVNWSNAIATLTTDVYIPPEPAQNVSTKSDGHQTAVLYYNTDPAVLAALARQKTFGGAIDPNGVVLFRDVPPGNYILEVKLFNPDLKPSPLEYLGNLGNEPALVIAQLRAAVIAPDASGNSSEKTDLGNFSLEPF